MSIADWQRNGRCSGYPVEVFFPDEESRGRQRELEERAKRICFSCPVLLVCREHALASPERYGVWGAMTPRERAVAISESKSGKLVS